MFKYSLNIVYLFIFCKCFVEKDSDMDEKYSGKNVPKKFAVVL